MGELFFLFGMACVTCLGVITGWLRWLFRGAPGSGALGTVIVAGMLGALGGALLGIVVLYLLLFLIPALSAWVRSGGVHGGAQAGAFMLLLLASLGGALCGAILCSGWVIRRVEKRRCPQD
jgi:hypothetical protein